MQLSGAYSDLSDADLDALYSTTYSAFASASIYDKTTLSIALSGIASEIIDRLINVSSFITGFFGFTKFPLYDAIQKADPSLKGFQQSTVAQTAVSQNASQLATNVTSAVKWGLSGTALVAAGLVGLYIYVNRRK